MTTNFDCRIEQAALDGGRQLHRYVVGQTLADLASRPQLIKLHGSFAHPDYGRKGSKPVATLTQIARFGLAFSVKRRLRQYLEQHCAGRTLIVAGYSASDSFDVTPLIESLPWKSVIWLCHAEKAGPDQYIGAEAAGQFGEKLLFDKPLDLLCMGMLARAPGKPTVVLRTGPTAPNLLALALPGAGNDGGFAPKFIERNLDALDLALASHPLDEATRTFVCNALLNESYGRMSDADIGAEFDHDAPLDEGAGATWDMIARLHSTRQFTPALALLEQELDDGSSYYAFEARLKAKLEFAEFMFNDGDDAPAIATARAAERLARARGCVWALVQAQRQLAKYELELALRGPARRRRTALRRVRTRQKEAIYYALRCGYVDDAFDTMRLLAHVDQWLDGQVAPGHTAALQTLLLHARDPDMLFTFYEERAALAIDAGDRQAYRADLRALSRLVDAMPGDVFEAALAMLRARWHLYRRNWKRASAWIDKASAICANKEVGKRFLARIEHIRRAILAARPAKARAAA